MKRIIALLISIAVMMTACSNHSQTEDVPLTYSTSSISETTSLIETDDFDYDIINGVDEPNQFQTLYDSVYSSLENELASDDFEIEEISISYLDREYLLESTYNNLENIYFGYKLSDLDEYFGDKKYIFTVDEEQNETIVQEFVPYVEDNFYDQIIENIAVGAGVILVCVTVSVIAGAIGGPVALGATLSTSNKISVIFAAAASTGTEMALGGAVFGGATSAIITAYQTGDVEEALREAALGASSGFKYGAIFGAATGAVQGLIAVNTPVEIRTWRESEEDALRLLRNDMPADVIVDDQLAFLNHEQVPYTTQFSTRPDIVIDNHGVIEAVEVKNYDLVNNYNQLRDELIRQVGDRVINLPSGSTQRIMLDISGRGYSTKFVNDVITRLQADLFEVYGGTIPITTF